MFSFHTKHLLFLVGLFFVFNVVSGANDNTTCVTVINNNSTTLPADATKLTISFPSSLNPVIEYYPSTNGNLEVGVTWCSDDSSLISTWENLFANISMADALVFLGLHNEEEQSSSTSDGVRLTSSLTFVSVLFASLFFLPKSRLTGVLVIAILCIALCAPTQAASSSNVITVRIGLPPQITQVCVNSNTNCTSGLSPSAPTTPPTNAPPTESPNPSTSSTPSDAPTNSPTSGSSSTSSTPSSTTSPSSTSGSPSDAPTNAPTSAPTSAPTPAPTASPATAYFNLRVLIISFPPNNADPTLGADFARLAFDSVGMPYDYVMISGSTFDISSYLSTTGTGKYSGIVTVYTSGTDPLTADQNAVITAYQQYFGVKWVIVGCNSVNGLTGVTSGTSVNTEYFQVTLATEFAQYGKFLNQSASVNTLTTINWSPYQNTPSILLPITITDSTTVTPVLMAYPSSGKTVAAAVFKNTDGTEQMRYFLTQGSDYIHSMTFASVMVNWISPGGLFLGARRITFSVQPDDLFLGSYVWNLTTHTNPTGVNDTWYRISADDLQNLADNIATINTGLPATSFVTVEWPTNFGGVNNAYYTRNEHDFLYDKAVELISKFYYLSHTWDHPCTFDTMTVAQGLANMTYETKNNTLFAPSFFGNQMNLWSNSSMITPCVTGLYNGGALQAMWNDGITACVSDESVTSGVDFEPITAYHGVYSTEEVNGFAGTYFVPRQALDIDYCARTPDDVVDEYNSEPAHTAALMFEQIMTVQRLYAISNKIAFRHDPFMLHQTNAATFFYNDPNPDPRFGFGSAYNTSLVALFMQRVVGDIMLYYNLPIKAVQMDNLVTMFKQRDEMDACGITATLGISASKQIVDLSVTSTNSCQMSLSGGATLTGATVTMEHYSVETTAWIELTAANTQTFSLSTPIAL